MQSIQFLDDISSKYSVLELQLDQKLKQIAKEEEKLNQVNSAIQAERDCPPNSPNSLLEAQTRNASILRDLEVAKARLRSRASYSPLESILQKAVQNYLDELSHFSSQNTTSSPEKSTTTSSIVRKTYGPTYL